MVRRPNFSRWAAETLPTPQMRETGSGARNAAISVLPVGTTRFKAVQDAVRKAKASGIEDGGTLTVKFSGEKPHEKRGYNPIKLFEATYVPPVGGTAGALDDLVKAVSK